MLTKNVVRCLSLIVLLAAASTAQANPEPAGSTEAYNTLSQKIEAALIVLKADAGSCGMIGGMLAGKMDSSIAETRDSRAKLNTAVAARAKGRPTVQALITLAERNYQQLESNLSMVRGGLSGDASNTRCTRARGAFETMVSASQRIPALLKTILQYLD